MVLDSWHLLVQVGCVAAGLVLALTAGWLHRSLYLGTAAVGFCLSLLFASGGG